MQNADSVRSVNQRNVGVHSGLSAADLARSPLRSRSPAPFSARSAPFSAPLTFRSHALASKARPLREVLIPDCGGGVAVREIFLENDLPNGEKSYIWWPNSPAKKRFMKAYTHLRCSYLCNETFLIRKSCMLSQGNRAMPHCSFRFKVRRRHSL